MDLNFGGLGAVVRSWMLSGAFWTLLFFALAFLILGGLWYRKRRKFNKPVLERYDFGEGKDAVNNTKGGWFKKNFTFFGLWDYGTENIFRLKDGTPVIDVSHNDYKMIDGVLGIEVVRSPHDPKIVVPISKFKLDDQSKMLLAQVAPADLRDAAESANQQADAEMSRKWERYMPILTAGLLVILILGALIFITQYGKHNIEKTAETLKYATDALAQIKNSAAAVPSSGVAP